ncbi:hypothetical protein B0H14DRAFT_3787563 [Mycena olivaceomarginata]|nr:hypothetical protein B0H14DRAFT_3787563 [Mycena olivaceomarginata]
MTNTQHRPIETLALNDESDYAVQKYKVPGIQEHYVQGLHVAKPIDEPFKNWRGFQGGRDRLEREHIVIDNNLNASAQYGGLARGGDRDSDSEDSASDELVQAQACAKRVSTVKKSRLQATHLKATIPAQMRVSLDPRLYNLPRSVDPSSRNDVACTPWPQSVDLEAAKKGEQLSVNCRPFAQRARPLLRCRSADVRQAKDRGDRDQIAATSGGRAAAQGPSSTGTNGEGCGGHAERARQARETSAKTARASGENNVCMKGGKPRLSKAQVCWRGGRRREPEKEGNHREAGPLKRPIGFPVIPGHERAGALPAAVVGKRKKESETFDRSCEPRWRVTLGGDIESAGAGRVDAGIEFDLRVEKRSDESGIEMNRAGNNTRRRHAIQLKWWHRRQFLITVQASKTGHG